MRRLAPALIALLLLAPACEDHRSPVTQAVDWFPSSQQATARCIVQHESGGNPRAVSSSGDYGSFQINSVHRREFERLTGKPWNPAIFDPRLNGLYALTLWRAQGWHPWSTRHLCGA